MGHKRDKFVHRATRRDQSPYARAQRHDDVFRHAQTRALRHYKLDLTRAQYEVWCAQIRANAVEHLGPARRCGHLWRVAIGELELCALFRDDLIRTFLPWSSAELLPADADDQFLE